MPSRRAVIRKSHESLQNKIFYEADFSDSGSVNDVFGHGTQVALSFEIDTLSIW